MRPPTVSRDVLVQRLCVTTLGLTTLVLVAACTRTTRTIVLVPTREAEAAGPSTAATLGVPPGHLPKPGECRVWIPGVPPGRQPRPKSRACGGIEAGGPLGSWIRYRPTADRRLVDLRAGVRARGRV